MRVRGDVVLTPDVSLSVAAVQAEVQAEVGAGTNWLTRTMQNGKQELLRRGIPKNKEY